VRLDASRVKIGAGEHRREVLLRLYAVILVGITLAFVPLGGAATGPTTLTFKVDSIVDEVDAKPGDGVCKSGSGHCTLRAALNEVSSMASAGKPVVISVPEGAFNLQIDPPAPATLDEAGGDLDLVSHDTPPPSVTITGAGSDKTTITQLRTDRVFELSAPEPVTISGLSIRGGSTVSQGGGIANSETGGLTVDKSEITGNSAEEGGGIYSRRPLTVQDSRIADNTAGAAGGGIAMSTGGGKVTGAAISGNAAGQLGGGIWLQNVDSAQISRTLVSGNSVTATQLAGAPPSGGGIEVDTDPRFGSTTVQITYSTIRGNSAAGAGGGLFWQATGTLILDSSLVAANTAETGGGIATGSGPSNAAIGTIQLTNTSLSGNVAERGGGIERSQGNTLLRAVTIAGNSAPRGSGIAFAGGRSIYSVATGLIVANVPPSQNCALTTGLFPAAASLSVPGANLESGAGCHLRTSDLSSTNPLLAPLANNGGPSQTRALLPGSPAVDRYTGADCPTLDQRGYRRPAGAACDIGAFEQSAVRSIDVNAPPRAIQDVVGGTLTLIPSGARPTSLHGRDYRPCTGKRHLNERISGGFFDSPQGRLAARGTLSFVRKAGRSVTFGNFLVMLDGTIGHVFATLAPTNGALQLFDVTGVRYGEERASGRLYLTATAARLLNHRLGEGGFQGGMECGRISLRARVFHEPKPPPKPPAPPPPPKPTTTTTTTTTPSGSTLTVVVDPSEGGSVHSSRAGIACPTACTFTFAPGESVKLEANAHEDRNYVFDHWDGSCSGSNTTCTVTMDQNRTVTAKFKKK
jgi:uncharacterized repeat protein (TIGR02543 family)